MNIKEKKTTTNITEAIDLLFSIRDRINDITVDEIATGVFIDVEIRTITQESSTK